MRSMAVAIERPLNAEKNENVNNINSNIEKIVINDKSFLW